jgi:hypothetical protein
VVTGAGRRGAERAAGDAGVAVGVTFLMAGTARATARGMARADVATDEAGEAPEATIR